MWLGATESEATVTEEKVVSSFPDMITCALSVTTTALSVNFLKLSLNVLYQALF